MYLLVKRALITGITGQDGPYLAKLLLSKGYKVYGTYRRNSTPNFWRLQQLGIVRDVTLIPADMSDMASLLEAVKVSDPDEIYNLAAQSFVGSSFDQPLLTTDVDGSGTTRFLEIIRHLKKEIKFYQASTSELYGASSQGPQSETTSFLPNSPYAAAKLYSYHMVRVYRSAYGIFACNGILFNHECISENTPLILRDANTNIISISRIKDFKRARKKGNTIQHWQMPGVEIWDGEAFVDVRAITATKRKKSDENFHCKTINTRLGVIETTNHHSLLRKDFSKIKAKEVSVGDTLLHKEFPRAEPISTVSVQEALFLGMMAGDGYISEDGKGQFTNNDPKMMDSLKTLWKKISLGSITIRSYNTEYGKATQAKLNGNSDYLRFLHQEIYTYDGFKKVPERILNSDSEIKLAFLTGYNLTDGLKSNPCTYEFKNFKTNSILLAQGLLYLISQTTGQTWNITFEYDDKYYGYYSINLLSPINRKEKEEMVKQLLHSGLGQRAISRNTGISRTFIRMITQGGQAQQLHPLSKPKEEVKKILYHREQPEWVYDIETSSGKFMAGVGTIVIANSPLRGLEFVTRKITNSVAKIKLGLQSELRLGNLHTRRDWGFAPEYVYAMWKILQQKNPDDFVIATGETHTVGEFAQEAFKVVGLDWRDYVKSDDRLLRPLDVTHLCGDGKKAQQVLNWKPSISFKKLVEIMVKADLERWQKYLKGEVFPWDAPNYSSEMDIINRTVSREGRRQVSGKKGLLQHLRKVA